MEPIARNQTARSTRGEPMTIEKISKEQFEQEYAVKSGLTVDELREQGLHAEPCECDFILCRGWQMVSEQEVVA